MLIGGGLNHLRHVLTHGFPGNKSFWINFAEASFTTLPMCTFALLLIAHLNSLQRQLYLQANRDDLTSLPNRRWFTQNTPKTIAAPQALMIIDIDHFKDVNDRFGHDVGDKCLLDFAAQLKSILGTKVKYARIGGEEFSAFFPEITPAEVTEIASQISAGIQFDTGKGTRRWVTASVGVSLCDTKMSLTDALRSADKAVYEAKNAGRASYCIYPDATAKVSRPHAPLRSDAAPINALLA